MTSVFDRFTEWWERVGRLIGGDRKLAAAAWEAAFAQSTSYTADDAVDATEVRFANGRSVRIVDRDGAPVLLVDLCRCRVPGPGNGNSKCMSPLRAVCQCDCHRAVQGTAPAKETT